MTVPSLFRRALTLLLTLPLPAPLLAQEPPRGEPQVVREQAPFNGRVQVFTMRRGRLGIVVGLEEEKTDSIGALVQSVTPNGPADKAGIRSGDVIVRVNGRVLAQGDPRLSQGRPNPGLALSLVSARIRPGDTVTVQYLRGKERRNAAIVAGEDPVWTMTPRAPDLFEVPAPDRREFEEDPELRVRIEGQPGPPEPMRSPGFRMLMLSRPLADLEVVPLNPELGRYFGTSEGVLVINLPPDSKLGLKPGDVVFSVDGRRVKLPGQLLRTLQSYEPGESFKLEIMRLRKREVITGTASER